MEASSSPARGKKGLGKLVNKFKTVFGKGSTSHGTGESLHTVVVQRSSAPESEQEDMQANTSQQDSEVMTPEPHTMQAPVQPLEAIEADTLDCQDRAPVVMARDNLGIGQVKRSARNNPPLERVSKPIRMRVRYTCHRCKTSFGHDRECNCCRHRRCARCERYPPRKPRPQLELHALTSASVPLAEETLHETSGPVAVDHVCTCHECQTVIEIEVEECPNCHHNICEKCHTEAQLQSVDAQSMDMTSPAEEAERGTQPEEQKLPPDSNIANEQNLAESR